MFADRAAKMAYVGWAFFALIVIVLMLWVLGRGILFWSGINLVMWKDGSLHYEKRCYYLFLNGTESTPQWRNGNSPEEVSDQRCNVLLR